MRHRARYYELLLQVSTAGRWLQQVNAPGTQFQLIDALFETPMTTISLAAMKLGVTFPTAQNAIDRLVGLGVLEEITGRKRDRIYLAKKIAEQVK